MFDAINRLPQKRRRTEKQAVLAFSRNQATPLTEQASVEKFK